MVNEFWLFRSCLLLDGLRRRYNMISKVSFCGAIQLLISLKVRIFFFDSLSFNNITQCMLNFRYFKLSEELALILCFEVFN